MKLRKLTLKDKGLFDRFLQLRPHQLSSYSFQNIYVWKELFRIEWALIEDSLCIFFKDKFGCFLYLPPLTKNVQDQTLDQCFRVMDGLNHNKEISRIENIEEHDLKNYRNLGYQCRDKYPEYLCSQSQLAQLKGERFKPKRASFNYFTKNYKDEYLDFSPVFTDGCLNLYRDWMQARMAVKQDATYQGLLADNLNCLKNLLADYRRLDYVGRVVKITSQIKAFTFGFRLNSETFCILFEIADLSIKGLAQFIFRKFCSELSGYKYINIMDDSGLENLKRVKLSYRPVKLIPAYIATRQAP